MAAAIGMRKSNCNNKRVMKNSFWEYLERFFDFDDDAVAEKYKTENIMDYITLGETIVYPDKETERD